MKTMSECLRSPEAKVTINNVGQLIAELQQHNPSLPVSISVSKGRWHRVSKVTETHIKEVLLHVGEER